MLFDAGLLAQKIGITTWEEIFKELPDWRLAVIAYYPGTPPKLVVEKASPKQLENFPELEGKICYSHVNGFSCPCPWCPVVKTIQDGQVHTDIARSPKPRTFSIDLEFQSDLRENGAISLGLQQEFRNNGISVSPSASILTEETGCKWLVTDGGKSYAVRKKEDSLIIYPTGELAIYEPDIGEMVYSILVTVPLWPGKDGAKRVLEISFDRTGKEKEVREGQFQKYKFESALCRSIGTTQDEAIVSDFILFGAVAEAGLGFQDAHLFLTDSDAPIDLGIPVLRRLTLTRSSRTITALKTITSRLRNGNRPVDMAILRGVLRPLIRRLPCQPPRSLKEMLLDYSVSEPQRLEGALSIPAGLRISSRRVLVPILSSRRRLYAVILAECGQNTLISDENVVDSSIFSLLVSRLLEGRSLTTAFRRAEEQLKVYTDQFGDSAQDLIITSGVVTGLAHDLRSSNRRLHFLIDTVLSATPKQRKESAAYKPIIKELLERLRFQSDCLTRITNTSLATKPVFLEHDFARLVSDVENSIEDTVNEAHANVYIRDHLQGKPVECDEFLIRQVFINLIENSIYWLSSAAKKEIKIELSVTDDQHIQIDYRDTGLGIAQEIRDQIWKPFFTTKPGAGLGLGLTIVKRIVTSHGGEIKLYYDAEGGACFRILLPFRQE